MKQENEIIKSEVMEQLVFEDAPDGIEIVNSNWEITNCNHAREKLTGHRRTEIIGKHTFDFFHPKSKKKFLNRILQEAASEIDDEFEVITRNKNKVYVWIKTRILYDDKNNFKGAINYIRIINDIKQQYKMSVDTVNEALNVVSENEQKYQALFDDSVDAIFIMTDTIFVDCNKAVEKLFAGSREKILNASIKDFLPPWHSDNNVTMEMIEEYIAKTIKGEPQRFDLELRRLDNTRLHTEISMNSFILNKQPFIQVIIHDITERYLHEEALQKSERKFRQLFHDIPDAIYVTSTDGESKGNILDINLAAELQSGYSREELLSMNVLSHLSRNGNDGELAKEREKQLQQNGTVHFEEKKVRKNGSEYWTDVILTKIAFGTGEAILSINRDITDKKEANEKIHKLSAAIEQSPTFIMITDLNGKIEYVNRKVLEITGYSKEELLGKVFRYETVKVFPKEEFKKLWPTLEKGKPWKSEFEITKSNGESIFVSASIASIINAHGKVTNYIGLMEDRTEQRNLMAQLAQSQKMESIGTLASGIAHDFNNLLTVINGYSELATNVLSKDEKAYNYFKSIFNAGERASRLVGQLLAFTRQKRAELKIIDINALVNDLHKMLSRLIGSDIHVAIQLDPEISFIKADPTQIEQILINLVVNARDAINAQKETTADRTIVITTEQVVLDDSYSAKHADITEGSYVCISVSDSGSGMSKEIKEKIFDPFFTTKEKGKGTGLGLATVYGIIKQNKGTIQVYSEPGEGTIFKIYWPATDSSAPEQMVSEKSYKPSVGNEHILLVDDDEEVRSLSAEMLTSLNYKVTEASSGEEAIKLIKQKSNHPDLVLTDLVMPGMNGVELAKEIKRVIPGIKILFASGFADERFFKADMDNLERNYIQKPYTLFSISKKIREICGTESDFN